MVKEIRFRVSSRVIYILIALVLVGAVLSLSWPRLSKQLTSPRIVSVDLIQIIRTGQSKYKTKPEIEAFTKRMNYILTNYADKHDVIILSKQVVIKGVDDVTGEVSKHIFKVK